MKIRILFLLLLVTPFLVFSTSALAQEKNNGDSPTLISVDGATKNEIELTKSKKVTVIKKVREPDRIKNIQLYRNNIEYAIKAKSKSQIKSWVGKTLKGILVVKVETPSFLSELFVEDGDILLGYGNELLEKREDLEKFVEFVKKNDVIDLKLIRAGKHYLLKIKIS